MLKRAIFSIAFFFALVSMGYADEPATKPALVPGSADVIHDVQGIAIGMTCQDAIAVASKISVSPVRPGQIPYNLVKLRGGARLDNIRVQYDYARYSVPLMMRGHIVYDTAQFYCLEDGGDRHVFELARTITFVESIQRGPSIASLRATFQEKYGVPGVEFSPFAFATMFNRKGLIQAKGKSCVEYQNGHLYDQAFAPFNADLCSYALTFAGVETRNPPGSVAEIQIVIRDFLRLENDVRAIESKRLETTPVDAPKL